MRAISERLRDVFTTEYYTNLRLPFTFTLPVLKACGIQEGTRSAESKDKLERNGQ